MRKIIAMILILLVSISSAEISIVNENLPYDDLIEYKAWGEGFEYYTGLGNDPLGRATVAVAWLTQDNMPEGKRGELKYKPTGWKQAKYSCISGGWLYNRGHMIAYCLSGEGDNECNLFTATEYMNQVEMWSVEEDVYYYIKNGGKVLYRVTCEYGTNELVCRSVRIEALSTDTDEICFHVRITNEQPSIEINYADGSSKLK